VEGQNKKRRRAIIFKPMQSNIAERSRGISKNCSRRGTSVPSHHLVGAPSCWCRRKTGPGDSTLINGPQIKSQSETGTRFPKSTISLINSWGINTSVILILSLATTRSLLDILSLMSTSNDAHEAYEG
jgi:hypothetical protein